MLNTRRSSPNDPGGNPNSVSGSVDQVMRPLAMSHSQAAISATSIAIRSRSSFSLTPRCATVSAAVRSATRTSSSWLTCCSASCAFCRAATSRCSSWFTTRERARLAVQVDEDRHLRAQDPGVDGLAQIVDRADAVGAQDVLVLERVRGQEDDRDVLGAAALLDQVGELDAAHAAASGCRRSSPRSRGAAWRAALRRPSARARACTPLDASITSSASRLRGSSSTMRILTSSFMPCLRLQRYNQTRRSESNWSVFTGLAM